VFSLPPYKEAYPSSPLAAIPAINPVLQDAKLARAMLCKSRNLQENLADGCRFAARTASTVSLVSVQVASQGRAEY
jgi:hypothetical protein